MSQASRSTPLVGTIAAVLIVGIAACAPAPVATPTAPPPSPAPTTPPTPTPVPTAMPVPTATSTPFVPKATVKIVAETWGIFDIAKAAELAVDQFAPGLQDLGLEVTYAAYEDQDDVDIAVANMKELIADDEVLCGVGPVSSRVTLNVMDLYHVAGLAFVSPSATSPNVSTRNYLEVNRVIGRDDMVAVAAAGFLESEGIGTAYVIRNENDYASRAADTLKRSADQGSVSLVGELTESEQLGNADAAVGQILEAAPEAVFYAGLADQAGPFFQRLRLAGYTGTLLSVADNPALIQDAGPLALEGGGLFYVTQVAPVLQLAGAEQFTREFEDRFGAPPKPLTAESYDAARVCLQAILDAATAKGGELPTRAEVAQAVRSLTDFPGITGAISFDKNGDLAMGRYYVFQVTSLDPDKWGQNTLVRTVELPPPE
jgi:branched-chain amino acid transport system substrate-binding protein